MTRSPGSPGSPARPGGPPRKGLERGPVLVQVARAGYAPSLVCDTCREPARCTACSGPLAIAGPAGSSAVPQCRWCSAPAPAWRCGTCNGARLRRGATGALRTAEELGRAFPGKPVITSSGDQIKATVAETAALVVATVGAEPVAFGGYAAALLLDGDSLLRRENLRAGEDAVRRWFNAAALVRPASEGGLVVITADDAAGVGALLRWDPAGYASGNWHCGRSCSCRPPCGSPPSPAAGPPSAISPRPLNSGWRRREPSSGRPGPRRSFCRRPRGQAARRRGMLCPGRRRGGPDPAVHPLRPGRGCHGRHAGRQGGGRSQAQRRPGATAPGRRRRPVGLPPPPLPSPGPPPPAGAVRGGSRTATYSRSGYFRAGPVPERDGLFGDGHEPPRRLIPAEVCGPLH